MPEKGQGKCQFKPGLVSVAHPSEDCEISVKCPPNNNWVHLVWGSGLRPWWWSQDRRGFVLSPGVSEPAPARTCPDSCKDCPPWEQVELFSSAPSTENSPAACWLNKSQAGNVQSYTAPRLCGKKSKVKHGCPIPGSAPGQGGTAWAVEGAGTGWFLWSFPTQVILWFYTLNTSWLKLLSRDIDIEISHLKYCCIYKGKIFMTRKPQPAGDECLQYSNSCSFLKASFYNIYAFYYRFKNLANKV